MENAELIREFDLTKSLPFSQGYAAQEIMQSIGGKIVRLGEAKLPAELSNVEGSVLFIESKRGGSKAETLWLDDGCSVACLVDVEGIHGKKGSGEKG